MTIPTLPPLERTSPSFAADLDTFFLTQLPATIPAFNAEMERVNQFAFGSYSATSTTSLTVGTGSKSLTIEAGKGFTLGQPVLIASTAAPSTYMNGQVVAYDSATGAMTVNVTSISGGGAAAVWSVSVSSVLFGVPSPLLQRTITATGTLSGSDKGKLINVNGTFTLGVAEAATLGAGWFCYLRNTGTGVITLDPNASETVDGVTSGPVRCTVLLICDGAGFTAIKQGPFTTTEMLNSGTSWTAPLGVRTIRARGQGGSGGAGGPAGARTGGGGGGGFDVVAAVSPGTTYTYAIGGGGTDGAPGGNGTNGGATTLDIAGVVYYAGPGLSTNNAYAGGGGGGTSAFLMQGETGQSSPSGAPIYGRGALGYGPGGNMVLNGGVLVLEY